jgi:DNA invertase Pin-like site-specific DNA recombinase
MEKTSITSTNALVPIRAAHYVRMSTEHQQYSPENQLDVIRQYAASHAMEIVNEYSDHGRSGLNIAGREGLSKLMSDVESKRTDFSALLVYDISRWGRFQDVDESAYYEYVLKRAGIHVHYCAEQFENDGSMSSSILTSVVTAKPAIRGHFKTGHRDWPKT